MEEPAAEVAGGGGGGGEGGDTTGELAGGGGEGEKEGKRQLSWLEVAKTAGKEVDTAAEVYWSWQWGCWGSGSRRRLWL